MVEDLDRIEQREEGRKNLEDEQHYVDLGQVLPDEILTRLGMIYVLFGRLEFMVLIAIKRLRKMKIDEAESRYKGYTLGAKLHGKNPCKKAGRDCRDYSSEPGLFELSKDLPNVRNVCDRVEELIPKRNNYIHGLITSAIPGSRHSETRLRKETGSWKLEEEELYCLMDSISDAIDELNTAVPVAGLHTSLVSGHADVDVSYTRSALEELGIRILKE